MNGKRSRFLAQLREKQSRESGTPEPKAIEDMSEQELDAEVGRLKSELSSLKREAVAAGREAKAEAQNTRLSSAPIFSRTRRSWK